MGVKVEPPKTSEGLEVKPLSKHQDVINEVKQSLIDVIEELKSIDEVLQQVTLLIHPMEVLAGQEFMLVKVVLNDVEKRLFRVVYRHLDEMEKKLYVLEQSADDSKSEDKALRSKAEVYRIIASSAEQLLTKNPQLSKVMKFKVVTPKFVDKLKLREAMFLPDEHGNLTTWIGWRIGYKYVHIAYRTPTNYYYVRLKKEAVPEIEKMVARE